LVRNAPGSAITVHVLLHLIQLFPVDNVTHLIGFKFAAYAKKYEGDTPQSLYLTTVILASHQLLSLAALNPHLPPLAKIDDIYVKWKQKYQQRIKKLGVVSLNSSNKKTDASEDDDLMETFGESNQSIQLFVTMLDVGMEWDFAREIFNAGGGDEGAMTDYTVKCCCLSATLGSTLCDILHQAIDPIYTAKAANIGSSLCISKKEEEGELGLLGNAEYALLPKTVCEKKVLQLSVDLTLEKMLESISSIMEPIIVSGSIASHAVLYTKLCRLVRSMLLTLNSNEKPIQKVDDKVLEFMDRVLISSLSLFPFNPAIASELWAVLSLVSYPIRYALYASWRKHGLEKAALRSMVQPPKPLAQVESEVNTGISTKYLLKRMSKDNIKDMGRQVSKVAHNNPLVVFTLMLNQIESYDNLILMMVDTFKFMGVLSLDVMGYCLLVSLGGEGEGRNKLKGKIYCQIF
jgi:THO complex subunit 2